ncbi:dolichyl-diphosphooligosaccharide--protein glycosyltransferase subunit DAD1 isoform X1 [Lepidochelys kempii]|uniref:dolichyl-diphosphooligosaccharide--protein glycosyltransferase subunit DAD1 isoform X1 n=1 Tax=Lepidochelys kempii TaxID=8472 RepID=UPI003C6F6968
MSGAAAAGGGSVGSVVRRFLAEYSSGTASRLKVLDAYLLYVLLSGALQFGYCLGVGTFPFNSFLSGFISAVGSFILGVSLGERTCVYLSGRLDSWQKTMQPLPRVTPMASLLHRNCCLLAPLPGHLLLKLLSSVGSFILGGK